MLKKRAPSPLPESPHESLSAAWSFRTRYLALTFAFIALVVALILTGQFAVLALLLMIAMIYTPRVVAWMEREKASKRAPHPPPLPSPWGER